MRDDSLYVPVHMGIWSSPKLRRLAKDLGSKPHLVIGHLIALWHAALQHCPDGTLEGWDEDDIAEVACWEGDPGVFVAALRARGWLDEEDDNYIVHGWEDYAGRGLSERRKEREKKREQRAEKRGKKRGGSSGGIGGAGREARGGSQIVPDCRRDVPDMSPDVPGTSQGHIGTSRDNAGTSPPERERERELEQEQEAKGEPRKDNVPSRAGWRANGSPPSASPPPPEPYDGADAFSEQWGLPPTAAPPDADPLSAVPRECRTAFQRWCDGVATDRARAHPNRRRQSWQDIAGIFGGRIAPLVTEKGAPAFVAGIERQLADRFNLGALRDTPFRSLAAAAEQARADALTGAGRGARGAPPPGMRQCGPPPSTEPSKILGPTDVDDPEVAIAYRWSLQDWLDGRRAAGLPDPEISAEHWSFAKVLHLDDWKPETLSGAPA
jgi:hypothetical protein